MESTYSKDEFLKRLEELSEKGDPAFLTSPFAIHKTLFGKENPSKPFYGRTSIDRFEITLNSKPYIPIKIKGSLANSNNENSVVEYKVVPVSISYHLNKIAPLTVGIFLLLIIIISFDSLSGKEKIGLSITFLLATLLVYFVNVRNFKRKEILVQKFEQLLKVT